MATACLARPLFLSVSIVRGSAISLPLPCGLFRSFFLHFVVAVELVGHWEQALRSF